MLMTLDYLTSFFFGMMNARGEFMGRIIFDTPLGHMKIESEHGFITKLDLTNDPIIDSNEQVLNEAVNQMNAYFKGEMAFNLPIRPKGTPFQQKVYQALCQIPFGKTASYSDIAKMIHVENGQRAVGQAVNKNPIMIVIPCHRIIGKNGGLVGFYGGLPLKEKLLRHEGIR